MTVTMFWDFGSAVSSQRQAAGDHVQASVSRKLQQQEQLQDPHLPQLASRNCSRCQRRRCATLSQVTIQYSNQLWKVQTGRTTLSSTETSQSALSASVGLHDKFSLNIMKRSSGNRTRSQGLCSGLLRLRREGHVQDFKLYLGGRP